jgi:transposase
MAGDGCSYDGPMSARLEAVVVRSERRRRWTDGQKLQMVRESLLPGGSVCAVARRYGIGTGQLYTWRRQLLSAATDAAGDAAGEGFVSCEIVDAPLPLSVAPAGDGVLANTARPAVVGRIEVDLPGGARVRVHGAADGATLRLVLAALVGR